MIYKKSNGKKYIEKIQHINTVKKLSHKNGIKSALKKGIPLPLTDQKFWRNWAPGFSGIAPPSPESFRPPWST